MQSADPYLNFKGNTEEVFEFYRSVFGSEFDSVFRFRDFEESAMDVPEGDLDKIAHISLRLGSSMLMGTDILESQDMPFTVGNNVSIMVTADSVEEATSIFNGLSAGGQIDMPLQKTEWAEIYGAFSDRFGVNWMVTV